MVLFPELHCMKTLVASINPPMVFHESARVIMESAVHVPMDGKKMISKIISMDMSAAVCTATRIKFLHIFSIRFIFGEMIDRKTFL